MIETRYSIEYIDPSAGKSPSKLARFFIYSALTISVLAAISALIFSNLPDSTSQIIKGKAQQFISSFNETSTNSSAEEEIIVSEPKTPLIALEQTHAQTDDKNELAQQRLIATQLENEYKKEIERLSQENTTQHDETVKQLTTNQSLTKKIDVLSKQLNNEIQKSALLKKEVTSLQTENKTVSALLKKTEKNAKVYTDTIKKLEQKEVKVVTQPAIIKPVTPEPVEIKVITKPTENTSTSDKNEAPISQIDAIVAAMEAATNQNNEASNPTVKK